MMLGQMNKEKALEIFRRSEELKAQAASRILESIEWDRNDFVYFNFGHDYNNGLDTYNTIEIDIVEINGVLHAEAYANPDVIVVTDDSDSDYTYNTFLADASKLMQVEFSSVEEALKAIEAKLTTEWQDRLSNSTLEKYFLDNYDWLYDDYEVKEA